MELMVASPSGELISADPDRNPIAGRPLLRSIGVHCTLTIYIFARTQYPGR